MPTRESFNFFKIFVKILSQIIRTLSAKSTNLFAVTGDLKCKPMSLEKYDAYKDCLASSCMCHLCFFLHMYVQVSVK